MTRSVKRWVYLPVVAVLLVGVLGTVLGFAYSRSAQHRNDSVLLRQEAGQAGFFLISIINQLDSQFTAAGTKVVDGGSQSAFAAAAASLVHAGTASAFYLLHDTDGRLVPVAGSGTASRTFGGAADAPLIKAAAAGGAHVVGVDAAGENHILEVTAGAPTVPAGYLLYWEISSPSYVDLQSIKGLPFSSIEGALYFGTESPANLYFATTRSLPLQGNRVLVDIADNDDSYFPAPRAAGAHAASSDHLFLLIAPAGPLSGTVASYFPWLLLGFGIASTVAVALVLWLSLRRRDEALELVDELEEKNVALDRAVTRQRETEDHLRQVQHLEAVGQLAGGIAHDFNNLLHVILTYTSFIETSVDLHSSVRNDLHEVRDAAQRAAELTRQLLVFARREMVKPEVLEANRIVRDTEMLLHHTLGEDVAVHITTSGSPCYFLGDMGEIKQVLVNLAINARDAMPRGGSFDIVLRRDSLDGDQARVSGVVPGPYVRIDMTDSGEGMAPETAARAFEPFFTTKETGRGTGLGLAMVYGIVARWGGTTTLRSRLGQGTTVSILLPITSDDPAVAEHDGPEAPVPVRQDAKVVLLVEDQDQVRSSTARILHRAGYEVVEAPDAETAERLFADHAVDLLLTDVVMPGGRTGKDLADDIHRVSPDLPVVFVTGYGTDAMTERGILPPNVTLMEKPFSADALLQTLDAVLREPAGTR